MSQAACSYGRYSSQSLLYNYSVPAKLAWFLQELPSLLIPLGALWQVGWKVAKVANQPLFTYFCSGSYSARGTDIFKVFSMQNMQSTQLITSGPLEISLVFQYLLLYQEQFFWRNFGVVWIRSLRSNTDCLAFCLFTIANTMPRAIEHHRWYQQKFDNYPKDRKQVTLFFQIHKLSFIIMTQKLAVALIPASTSASKETIDDGNVLDALPYIDDVNYTEEHRQLALQLIQAECRNFPMTKNYLRNFKQPNYDSFLTPRIKEQFSNISEKKEMEKIDLVRYEVSSPANTSKSGDKKAWQNAIQNCKSQLGNQCLRKLNLEIMEEFGGPAYLQFNKHLQQIAEKEESNVLQLRSELYEINARRKRTQLAAGENLLSWEQIGWSW
uniref:Pre-mRNA-splicing factor SPF27 n=1 Tax=Ditylenchus dipsaci TaxID=166011 RepID=A0A915EBN0_9BILA